MDVDAPLDLSAGQATAGHDLAYTVDRSKATSTPFVTVGEGAQQHLQHEDLWFDDGNILVIARNVWFKLFRGILAKYSSIFRDMFQLADAAAGDNLNGCPTVSVTDDPEHLVLFFTLLYDGGRHPFLLDPKYYVDFRDLRGLAFLSFKYDVQHIQAEVIRRLRVCFPDSLADWDLRYPHSFSKFAGANADKSPEDTLDFQHIDSIAVINLARRFNIVDLLPAAFYICAMQDSEKIFARIFYGDEHPEELPCNDLNRCFQGLQGFRTYIHMCGLGDFEELVTQYSCTRLGQDTCFKAWAMIFATYVSDLRYSRSESVDILYTMSKWLDQQPQGLRDPLCKGCLDGVKDLLDYWRADRWDEMSESFCLG